MEAAARHGIAAQLKVTLPQDEYFHSLAVLYDNLGVMLQKIKPREAEEAHRSALYYAHQGNSDPDTLITTHLNLGWLLYSQALLNDATKEAVLLVSLDHFDQALALARSMEDEEREADVLTQRSLPLTESGRRTEALKDLKRARHVYFKRESWNSLALAFNNTGVALQAESSGLKPALRAFAVAEILCTRSGDDSLTKTVHRNIESLEARLKVRVSRMEAH